MLYARDQADQKNVASFDLNNKGCFGENLGIRTNLAVALLKLGQWDEGLAELREALRRDPHNETLQKALDDALAQYRAHLPQSAK